MFAEAGLITPEMASALKNLNQIQTLAAEGNMDGIPAAVEALVNDLNDALANDYASNDLMQAMTEAMQLVSDKFGLQAVLEGAEFGALRQYVLKAIVTEKLTDMLGGVEGLSSEQIQEMIDQLSDPELQGADLINQLDGMNETLNNAGIKIPEIAALQDVALQNMPLSERLELLADKQAQSLMDLITELGGIDNLPPEMAELLDSLDIDTLALDELKDALAGNGDPALVEAVQNLVVQLQTPEIQSMLPAAAAAHVTQFLSENAQLVEAVTTQAIISEMNSTLVTNQAQNLMDIVAGLSGVEGVSPELAEILQQLDVAQPNLSDLKEALAGNGDPNLVAAVESLVAQLKAPESQALLSSAGRDVLSADGITSNNIPLSAETLEIAKAIKNLEDGGSLSAVDPKILTSAVADKVDGVTVSKADAIASIIATRSEAAEIIADFKTNPDLLNNPEVARRIDILSDAGLGEINAALANVKSSIVLAEKGSIPVEGKPGFSPDVVGPQLVAIASSIPTNTAEGKVAVALVESIQATVEKFGTDTPPTPIEIVKLANDANRLESMGVVPDAVKSQIAAISQGAQTPLPPEVKEAAEPALGGCTGKPCGCCPSDDMKRATAVTSVEPDGKVVITLKANDTNNPNDVVKLEFESKEKYDAYVKADAKASEVMSSLTQNQHGLSDQQITNSVLARLNQAQRESKTKMGEHFCDANCNHAPVIHQQDYDQADLADASAKKSSAPLTAEEVQKSFDEFFEVEVEKDKPKVGGGCEDTPCDVCGKCFAEVAKPKKGETVEQATARQDAEILSEVDDDIEQRVAAAKAAQAKSAGPSAKAA